jgi:hypothetical protein
MDPLRAIFCDIDDCCKDFAPVHRRRLLHVGQRQRTRQTTLTLSERLTLLVYFHWRHDRTRTPYYTEYVAVHLRPSFPQLVGYARFVELIPRALGPLCGYLCTRKGRCTGIAFIASTPLAVCDNHRIVTHKGLAGLATRGKPSMGSFSGCKLHLIVHDAGELRAFRLPPGPVDARQPVVRLAAGLGGPLFGDRGDISPAWHEVLLRQGRALLTKLRRHRKNRVSRR